MSLLELFSAKQAFRKQERERRRLSDHARVARRSKPEAGSVPGNRFQMEVLEPRVLLSATPTENLAPQDLTTAAVTGPANALANLDVDLNGSADALSDGIVVIRHLFGFTGNALTDGAVDPAGQRTDPAAITAYLNQFGNAMLDVDLNGNADALSDGILIIRNLFGFTGSALTDGAVDPSGVRTDAAVIATFLNNMNPALENIPPAVTIGLASDTGVSATDRITSSATLTGTMADLNAITSFRAGFDNTQPAAFVDILSDLQGNGTFTLNTARLDQINGAALADGAHTLHLSAVDSRGNSRQIDFTFTLDRQAPGLAGVGLSPGSDTGTTGDNVTAALKVVITGSTDPGVLVTIGAQSALATGAGTFQIPDVALVAGANLLNLTASDVAGNQAQASLTVTQQGTVSTDVALAWNQLTLDAIRLSVTDPPIATRILAMVSLAQFDTLAAIEQTPAYLIQQTANGPVSVDAALAKAAHTVLYALFPSQRATFDAALNGLLAGIADGAAKTNALALGLAVGQGVLAVRANDGSEAYVDYPGGFGLGQWRPTEPMFDVADQPHWGDLTPFALTSGDQFRPAAPPALDSAAYAASVEDVRSFGSATGSARTADQTQAAQFWADGKGSYTPPGHWNAIAMQQAAQQGNSLSANVRLFAQLNVALADAAIAAWDAKYTYGLWRPVDAIRNADVDNNPGTTVDSTWTPLLITPSHPEYVSGHSTFSSAAATILAATFGNNVSFGTTAFTLPNITRNFTSFTQAAQEAGRSRIYGGIHYEFTNQAGLQLGQDVGNAVLARFTLNSDIQAPVIVANASPSVTKTNLTLTGQILDNISGIALAQFRIDNGPLQTLSLTAQGQFSITTPFALDGTADGLHTISILAADAAGNSAPTFTRSVRLDTRLPVVTLPSIADSAVIDANTRLTGTADPTGSPLTQLTYRFDNGPVRSLFFNNTTGAFDNPLFIGNLTVGAHQLTLTARDAAGNETSLTRNVTLNQAVPFTITGATPVQGAVDVGVTFQPQIVFSRAVNPASLTADSLYAIGSDGQKIPATIVTAQDGSFAWLFFTNPLPGGATITIKAEGHLITAAADQQVLDGNADGLPGGTFTRSFTTVSTVSVPGTRLVGKVVDPGPDLLPMTFDDMRRGPDGIIHTPDDQFLLPIVHAKVFILGQEDRFVFTDANGDFELIDVPVGNVKVAIDGRTATNAPAGLFFPEMVMDANLLPGIENTLMGSMAMDNNRQGLANLDRKEVYLPRLNANILQQVSNTAPTTVTADANSAPNLTDEERQALTLTITPGSAIGPDGQPLANSQIGVSTVPEELVQDMLPPGVLQHTFDITIQAPGVSTFAQPLQITFPNVFNAAPGEKLFVLSFDHTTGRLVINGTATVSADGKTVVSDADSGIKAPGWHGLTPPGPRGGSDAPGPPGPPPPPPSSGGVVIIVVGPPNNGGFNPTIQFPDFSLTLPQRGIVTQVADLLDNIVVGDLPAAVLSNGNVVDDILIQVRAQAIDGVGGDLAQTTVDEVRSVGPALPAKSTIILDTADLANPDLARIVLHQFLHALGFGSLFQSLGLVNLTNPADPLFTGANALAEFQALAGGAPTGVPLENAAGQPPEHWRESVFDRELMTGFLDLMGPFPLSRTSVAALRDMGYVVNMNAADPFTLPAVPAPGSQGTLSTLTIDAAIPTPAPFSRAYRLGASSPSDLPGFDPVTLANIYSDQAGFGWQPGSVSTLSIAAGPSGSIVKGTNAQFSVAVPNGIYELSLTLGGDTIAHDAMMVTLEGSRRGLVSTLPGELIATQYRVEVFDGRLDIQVTPDVGGTVALHSVQLIRLRDNLASNVPSTISGTFFVAIEDLTTGNVMRHSITLDPGEALCPDGVVFSPNRSYREWVYHLESGTIGWSDFTTPSSGVNFTLPNIQLGENVGVDGDLDGLSDASEFIIGTTDLKKDSDGDGATDYAEIHARTNPLDGRPAATGVLASVVLQGEAKAVSAEQGATGSSPIAAVATGSFGVAFVDMKQPDRPLLLREVNLPGDSTDVAFDANLGIAAVASNAGGLNLVTLAGTVRNIAINPTAVEVIDGFAYVNNGGDLMSFDLVSGDLLQTLAVGFVPIVTMAHEGNRLFTIDTNNVLRAFDVSSGAMIARDSLGLPAAAAKMFVGGGVAFIGAETGFTGGYMTVDVSDPNDLRLISGVDGTNIAGKALALNGSGLGITIGSLAFVGGTQNLLQIVNAADPSVTDAFIAQFTLPADPFDVVLASGLAFVADGTGGLVVVNYKSADNLGLPPTITLSPQVADFDPIAPGIQVQEGTVFQVIATVTDDVQVSNVELLVNGQIVRRDVAFPWDLFVTTPAIASAGTTLTVSAIATDTGGNAAASAPLTFTVVPDTFAPTVVETKPTNAAKPFFVPSIDVRFNEALNQSLLSTAGFQLVNIGADKTAGTGDDTNIGVASFLVRDRGTLLSMVPSAELTQGDYRLTINPTVIADIAGNQIAAPVIVNFTVRPASDVRALSGLPKIFQAPSANVGQEIGIGFSGADTGLRLVISTIDSGAATPGIAHVAPSRIDATAGQAFFIVPANANTGDINTTHIGQLNYTTFPLWDVTRGTVDLIGTPLAGSAFNDVVPGNGLYVDLDGSTSQSGRLESKATFNLAPGTYELRFKLAPSEGGSSPTNTVDVSLGTAFTETFTRPNNNAQTFETITRTITVTSATSGKLIFDQTNPGDNFGLYLDDVRLTNTSTGQVLFQDNFEFNLVDGAIPLQIVPTLVDVDQGAGDVYHNGGLRLRGTGFIEGAITINFGAQTVIDISPFSGPNIGFFFAQENDGLDMTVPVGAPFGPISVTTLGGTSTAFNLTFTGVARTQPVSFTGVTAVAASGTPTNAALPSANPGQAIVVQGSGLDFTTDVVFQLLDSNGTPSERVVRPVAVNESGTEAVVLVPLDSGLTGIVGIVGDQLNTQAQLQIVPILTGVDMTSVASDGSSAGFTLRGAGFVEGNNSTYTFGSVAVVDPNAGTGPNVFFGVAMDNDSVNLTVPLSAQAWGAVTVTTAGGTSAPFTRGFTGITGVALSGTPANPGQASANPGQTVILTGNGLSTATDLVAQYIDSNGTLITQLFNPSSVNGAGTEAQWSVPVQYSGAQSVRVVGSSAAVPLQIVPVVTSVDVTSTNAVTLRGRGFVEGNNTTYTFGSGTVVDPNAGTGPNVFFGVAFDNDSVSLSLPVAGAGNFTVATIGGTSAPVAWNAINPGITGTVVDVAYKATTDELFVASVGTGLIHRLNAATGAPLGTFAIPVQNSGNVGLQILITEITSLNGTVIPAGSLLVTNGAPNPDRVVALDSTTGAVLATLPLSEAAGEDLDAVAGVYHAASGHLFVLEPNADAIGEFDPATGARLGSTAAPFAISAGGLAVHPTTGNLWVGSNQSGTLAELSVTAGTPSTLTVVRQLDLTQLGIDGNEVNGLAFRDATTLLVSSTRGVVYVVPLNPPALGAPTLTGITAVAADGTPANGAAASANAGQVIELVGTNFRLNELQIQFATRDTAGNTGTVIVTPLAVSGDGTRAQVQTPALAETGTVQLVGGTGSVLLQIVPKLTGISGRPGQENATFDLVGSGFMEGASTITIGGHTFTDSFTNLAELDVFGQNDTYRVIAPFSIEGPIRVTTAGGFAEISGPSAPAPAYVDLVALQAVAGEGMPATAGASANTGQTIRLIGRGLTNSTLVQFDAIDDQGTSGILIRTGTAGSNGTTLDVEVPLLARTGIVKVVGDATTLALQIVPTLRAVGGTIGVGNTILLEGTGLIQNGLTITVDGQAVVGTPDVRAITDRGRDQQVVAVTVPAGISAGVITVTTVGGSATLRPITTITTQPDLTPGADVGNTLATATTLTVPVNSRITVHQAVALSGDVDLYAFTANAGDLLELSATRLNPSTNLSALRLFDAAGTQVAVDVASGPNSTPRLVIHVATTGTYYVGVSANGNTAYNPVTGAGANLNGVTGTYDLVVQRVDGLLTSITGITAGATLGTAANSALPSANTGQTITLTGSGFTSADRVVFESLNSSNAQLGDTGQITPTSVAGDGSSLTVVVPSEATSGLVRLAREQGGRFIQIVPTLVDVDQGAGDVYHNGGLRLRGTGFVEAGTTIEFGAQGVTDLAQSFGPNIGFFFAQENDGLDMTVPVGAPFGPISVTTLGGTSTAFNLTFTGITATATVGTPASPGLPSANPGQTITLTGTGFDTSTDVVFQTIDSNGTRSERVIRPVTVAGGGTSMTVVVPQDVAITGAVSIVGDQLNTQAQLQIVPILTGVDMTSVASDGSSAGFTLRGAGFVEGNNSTYTFGSVAVVDPNAGTGPNVFFGVAMDNDSVNLTVPLSAQAWGAVTVTTAGGTSAPFTRGFTGITGVALSGTPANPGQASANPGQTVILTGSGLSTATDLVAQYIDSNGTLITQLFNPSSVNGAGTEAQWSVPVQYSGAQDVRVVGSATAVPLQIVPVVTSVDVTSTNAVTLRGRGFVEGNNTTYTFGSGTVVDPNAGTGPNVFFGVAFDNDSVGLSLPVQGIGDFTVTTAGGTSAPLPWNVVAPGLGALIDVAYDPATTSVWVADSNNIHQIDKNTGAVLNTFDIPASGSTGNLGLQFLAAGFTLNGTAVSAGSLLVMNGQPANDQFIAVNATTGAMIASLTVGTNFDFVAGVYHAGRNTLFGLDGSPDQLIEINPATGATVNTFAIPSLDVQAGGLAIDNANNIWVGTSGSSNIRRFNVSNNTFDTTIDLAKDSISTELTGLAHEAPGFVVGSSNRGVVYFQLDPPVGDDPAPDAATESSPVTAEVAPAADSNLELAYVQQSWVKSFVSSPASTLMDHDEDDELVIALPAGV